MSGGKATAISLTCCCRSFEDPVLDSSWTTQDRLLTLFKSFPGDVRKESGCSMSAQTTCIFFFPYYPIRKSFERPPTTAEWARFWKYARRMPSVLPFHTDSALSSSLSSVLLVCTFFVFFVYPWPFIIHARTAIRASHNCPKSASDMNLARGSLLIYWIFRAWVPR